MTAPERAGNIAFDTLSLTELEELYREATAELAPSQVTEVECDNERMCTLFPKMAKALRLYRKLSERRAALNQVPQTKVIPPVGRVWP